MICLICTVFFYVSAQAQVRTVTGVVKDDAGEVVTGATVVIKGTTTGTTTDFDGKYSIRVDNNDLLEFSFIGYFYVKNRGRGWFARRFIPKVVEELPEAEEKQEKISGDDPE